MPTDRPSLTFSAVCDELPTNRTRSARASRIQRICAETKSASLLPGGACGCGTEAASMIRLRGSISQAGVLRATVGAGPAEGFRRAAARAEDSDDRWLAGRLGLDDLVEDELPSLDPVA